MVRHTICYQHHSTSETSTTAKLAGEAPRRVMFFKLLIAFIIVPLVELFLLLQIAEWTSIGATIALVILTGILGSWLARREGASAWRRFREALAGGRLPSEEIQDGLMVVFAAALLLTPGLLTDLFGFTLLVPQGRRWVRRHLFSRLFAPGSFRVTMSSFASQAPTRRNDSNTVDADRVRRRV